MTDFPNDATSPSIPTLSPESESTSDTGSPAPQQGTEASATGGEVVKKKRRRRGGKNRKKNKTPAAPGTEAPTNEADEEGDEGDDTETSDTSAPNPPHQSSPSPQSHPAPRQQQQQPRGGGGRDRNDRAPRSDNRSNRDNNNRRSEPPRHAEHQDHDDPTARPRPERKAPVLPTKEWEEIFEGKTFESLGLRNSVLKGCEAAGFKSPTKIQAEMIPLVLAGRDVIGQSRTGTGKTAAFGLPLFNGAHRDLPFQSLILAPTRELAIQIAMELSELGKFTPIRVSAVYGGQAVHSQARKLEKGPEIIVATPGRLMDMVERGHIHLNNVKYAVLDEVDRMLDIGFRDDIKRILGGIKGEHQTILVSATISEEIERLARTYMKNPEKLVTTGGSLTVSLVEQHYISVQPWDKRRMLLHCLTHEEPDLTIIFCRMKRTVDDVVKFLCNNKIDAHGMHGDLQQGRRNTVMARLREGTLSVLVASDLAARGLDVDGISHVINYDLPEDPEVYIHRIGRTARAGRGGVAWSLVTPEQGPLLTAIEKLANTHVPEKTYPDFKPGPLPADMEARRRADEARRANQGQQSRYNAPTLPAPSATTSAPAPSAAKSGPAPVVVTQIDASRFPGGIVPTMLPPKRLMGKVKTSRSMRSAPPAPTPGATPAPTDTPPQQ